MLGKLPRPRLFAAVLAGVSAGLSLVVASPTLADEPPEGVTAKQWKLDQLMFCMQSAAAAKQLFLKEMQKGCLSGAKRVPSDTSLCMMLTKPAGPKPKPTPGGVCAEPQPDLACTTCKAADTSSCYWSTAVSGSMSFEKTKDGDLMISSEQGSSFLVEGSYGGTLKTAHLAFQVKDSGHDGPYDLVSAVIDASFSYSESTLLTGRVAIGDRAYYPPVSFSCGHIEKGEKWAFSMHVDRDCTSPVNQTPASTGTGSPSAPAGPTAPPAPSTPPAGTTSSPEPPASDD